MLSEKTVKIQRILQKIRQIIQQGLIFFREYAIIKRTYQNLEDFCALRAWEMVKIKEKLKKLLEELRMLKTADGRKEFYFLHKEIILYFVFGVGTTIVSIGSYYICRLIFPDEDHVPVWLRWIFNITHVFGVESNTALPVIISWFLSVTFAFFTNRVYVFHSEVKSFGGFMLEALKLYASRVATLLVDLLIMFLLVDVPKIHNPLYEFCAKIFSNIIVLILNFILSKVFVFRNKKPKKTPHD